jgi:hypothetical protein
MLRHLRRSFGSAAGKLDLMGFKRPSRLLGDFQSRWRRSVRGHTVILMELKGQPIA